MQSRSNVVLSQTEADRMALANLIGLGNEHRLAIFRALVVAGRGGLMAGEIAERLRMADSSLSFHLSHLKRSGLVSHTREGRAIIYRADFAAMRTLIEYLLDRCCEDSPCCAAAPSTRTMKGPKEGPNIGAPT